MATLKVCSSCGEPWGTYESTQDDGVKVILQYNYCLICTSASGFFERLLAGFVAHHGCAVIPPQHIKECWMTAIQAAKIYAINEMIDQEEYARRNPPPLPKEEGKPPEPPRPKIFIQPGIERAP